MKRLLFLLSLIFLLPVGVYAYECGEETTTAIVDKAGLLKYIESGSLEFRDSTQSVEVDDVLTISTRSLFNSYHVCGYDEDLFISMNDVTLEQDWIDADNNKVDSDIYIVNPVYMYDVPSKKGNKVSDEKIGTGKEVESFKNVRDYVYVKYNGKGGWIQASNGTVAFGEDFFNGYAILSDHEMELCDNPLGDNCKKIDVFTGDLFQVKYYYTHDNSGVSFAEQYGVLYKGELKWVERSSRGLVGNYSEENFKNNNSGLKRKNTINISHIFKKYSTQIKIGFGAVVLLVIVILLMKAKKKTPVEEKKDVVQTQPFINNNNQTVNNINLMAAEPTQPVVQQPVQQVTPPVDLMAAEPVVQQSEPVVNKQPFIMEEEKKEEVVKEQSIANAFTDFKPTDKVE